MGETRVYVTEHARLKGMGRETTCTVMALKSNGSTTPAYTKVSVHRASESLPDGTYEITFLGFTCKMRRTAKQWVVSP